MSGGQWRVLSGLQAEADRLLRRLRQGTLSQQYWEYVMSRVDKSGWSRALPGGKEVEQAAGPGPAAPAGPGPAPGPRDQAREQHEQGAGPAADDLSLRGLLQGLKLRTDLHFRKITPPTMSTHKPIFHNEAEGGVRARTAHLVAALGAAEGAASRRKRTEDLLQHVYAHPHAAAHAVHEGAVRALLRVRRGAEGDAELQGAAREALAALGAVEAPRAPGPRVLALDGGGIRGLVAIHVLRRLEQLTGRRVRDLFDYIMGVSTGAIVAAYIAGDLGDLDGAADMYRRMSVEMFGGTSAVVGGARLVWSHAYYDTAAWERSLRARLGARSLGACARGGGPQLGVVSAAGGGARVHRSHGARAHVPLWAAVRASAAAPAYFHEFPLDGELHADGGLAHNNPAGLALREARRLWGRAELARATLVSVGCGRAPPARARPPPSSTSSSWREKFHRILDSATDTEGVHRLLSELLPPQSYYRFNPPLLAAVDMDETDPAKISALELATHAYLRRNHDKLARAARALARPRPPARRLLDACRERAVLLGLRGTTAP